MTAEDIEAYEMSGIAALLILAGVAGLIIAAVLAISWVAQERVYDRCKAGSSLIIGKEIYKCQKVGDL